MKISVICDECAKRFEMVDTTVQKRKERFGKVLCNSCSQKGYRNPIYNKKEGLGYRERRQKITVICDECAREFQITRERALMREKRYGMNLCLSCSRKGERNTFYDRHFSDKQLEMLSRIRKEYYSDELYGEFRREQQSLKFSGKNNPMYREEIENVYWRSRCIRDLVLKINNYTCQKCHEKKHPLELDAHHIISIKNDTSKRLDLENIACLCAKCHRAFHLIYGRKAAQDQFEAFIESSETIETMLQKHME